MLKLLYFRQASVEVERLTKLKASRMKELVLKRRSELEDICRMTHIKPDASTSVEKSNALIDSGICLVFPCHNVLLLDKLLWILFSADIVNDAYC